MRRRVFKTAANAVRALMLGLATKRQYAPNINRTGIS